MAGIRRLPGALCIVLAFAVLAACGGGGGSSTPPVGTPPSSNPGGNPSSSPSSNPSGTPSAGPSVKPSGAPSATPVPTNSPVSGSPTPSPAPSAFSWELGGAGVDGITNGLDDQFTTTAKNINNDPHDGDYMPGDPGAQPQGGGQGPIGSTIDGISCDKTMSNVYHVHAFLGLYVNGAQIAIPDAVGIDDPHGEFTDSDGWKNQEIYGTCFYHIHTHDASGLVHIEDPDPNGIPISGSLYSIGNFFDIWGIAVNSSQFGTFAGPVTVFTSGQFSRADDCQGEYCEVGSNSYTRWTGDPTQIPLYSHEVIWYEVGSGNPDAAHLPGINFDIAQ